MAEFVKVMKEMRRMCESIQDCRKCKISSYTNGVLMRCNEFMCDKPKNAEKIVMDWSEKNPEKTMLMNFKEKYPNAPLNGDGTPKICPEALGYSNCCSPDGCIACWNRPLSSLEGEQE